IPRDAHAVVTLPAGSADAFRTAFTASQDVLRPRFAGVDDAMTLDVADADADLDAAADLETTRRALDLVSALPTGVIALAPGLTGVVETSISLTVASTDEGTLTLASMARSSNARALDELLATAHALARLAGAELEVRRSYPPWEPRLESNLLRAATQTYARLFGGEPALAVVHGGLECAVLGGRLPRTARISIGPQISRPPRPGERVRTSSTPRFY